MDRRGRHLDQWQSQDFTVLITKELTHMPFNIGPMELLVLLVMLVLLTLVLRAIVK